MKLTNVVPGILEGEALANGGLDVGLRVADGAAGELASSCFGLVFSLGCGGERRGRGDAGGE